MDVPHLGSKSSITLLVTFAVIPAQGSAQIAITGGERPSADGLS
jgi:hypothetical protein